MRISTFWPFQTTLSNASQVVISQVETNISGKFSCEGNVMCAFANVGATKFNRATSMFAGGLGEL